jgi:pimeloyl-ACP methyl ester carboxylesterase
VAERLGDHRLLVPDRPGYGRSGREAGGIEDNAEVLGQLLVERGAAPAIVVGHSYGGGVAILLAARHPTLVSGLVLVGSIGRADSVNGLDRVLALPVVGEAVSAAGLFTLGHVLPRIRHVAGDRPGPRLAWLRASLPDGAYVGLSSHLGRRVWRTFVAEQRALLREIGTVETALNAVRAPTIVVSGAWDLVVPPSVSASVAAAVSGAELVTVAGVGHFVPRDAPDVVVSAVRRLAARSRRADGRPGGRPDAHEGADAAP